MARTLRQEVPNDPVIAAYALYLRAKVAHRCACNKWNRTGRDWTADEPMYVAQTRARYWMALESVIDAEASTLHGLIPKAKLAAASLTQGTTPLDERLARSLLRDVERLCGPA